MKAQSVLDYAMTYGWALLIIIIVGAALFALGVFNQSVCLETMNVTVVGSSLCQAAGDIEVYNESRNQWSCLSVKEICVRRQWK